MVESKKILENTENYVYDISLDGTVVNALGMNVCSNTDGFNFKLPDEGNFRYTDEHPYIGLGLNREVEKGKKYTGFKADVAEFNDLYMRGKMGLGIDEVVDATINFSRKNYADYFPENPFPEDVKMVGNTIKSKKMPEYISDFLSKGIRLLLQNKGQSFLEEYYDYVEKIYNYQIPLKKIASKGKLKKTIEEYKKDCNTLTKAGRPKSRQAWMELAIANNINPNLGETLYYYNTGKSKSQADVKKVTRYLQTVEDIIGTHEIDVTKQVEKGFGDVPRNEDGSKKIGMTDWIAQNYPGCRKVEEIVLNSVLLDAELVESNNDVFCDEDNLYNVPKYVDQFNKRITPLLVCFNKEIRDKILITNPKDRVYFTEEESKLSYGQPNKESDQDTYEQLMTMEDKEIKFWTSHPEFTPPFLKECNMDWEKIVEGYNKRVEEQQENGRNKLHYDYKGALLESSLSEFEAFVSDGKMPPKIAKIAEVDPMSSNIVAKSDNSVVLDTIGNIYDYYLFLKSINQ